jgi:hypothetical protein
MQVGCGVYAHTVRGKRYLYFWHYESRGGSRVQVKEYVGPAASSRARSEATQRCEAYYARAVEELERMRDTSLAALRAVGGH